MASSSATSCQHESTVVPKKLWRPLERHNLVRRRDQHESVTNARGREVVGDRSDVDLTLYLSRGRVEPVEDAVLAHGPHQTGHHEWRPTARDSRTPQHPH